MSGKHKEEKNRGGETLIETDLILSYTCFSQAEVIIHVTHGPGHLLYRELTQLLDQCTAELGS